MPPKPGTPGAAGGGKFARKSFGASKVKAANEEKAAEAAKGPAPKSAALLAYEEKERAKKEAAAAAQREWEEEQEAERRRLAESMKKRPKSPGRRHEPDELTRFHSSQKLREITDDAKIHDFALNGDEDKLRSLTNLHQDKEGKNYVRFLDSRDRHGNTALMNACWKGHLPVVRFLVESGASLNVQNFYGWTAMMWAVNHDALRVVEYLLSKGVDVNIVTPVGRTAIEFANNAEVRKMIQSVLDKPVAAPSSDMLKITN